MFDEWYCTTFHAALSIVVGVEEVESPVRVILSNTALPLAYTPIQNMFGRGGGGRTRNDSSEF